MGPLLLIGKFSRCGCSCFFHITVHKNVLSASLNKTFPSVTYLPPPTPHPKYPPALVAGIKPTPMNVNKLTFCPLTKNTKGVATSMISLMKSASFESLRTMKVGISCRGNAPQLTFYVTDARLARSPCEAQNVCQQSILPCPTFNYVVFHCER